MSCVALAQVTTEKNTQQRTNYFVTFQAAKNRQTQNFWSWEARQSSINKWVPCRVQLKCWCRNTKYGTLRAGVWQRATAAWCSGLQGSAMGGRANLGLSNRVRSMQCAEMCGNVQASPKKKKAKEKVLLNLFLAWGLQAPEGKQGCWAWLGLLAGREMPQSSAPSFISTGLWFHISPASSPLALLLPGQVPLGSLQKLKYCHHIFILNQCSLLTPRCDRAQSPGCCQILSDLRLSSRNFC